MASREMELDQSVASETKSSGLTNVSAVIYGKVVTLTFSSTAITNGTIGSLGANIPKPKIAVGTACRVKIDSDGTYYPGYLSITTSGGIGVSYYKPGTTTAIGGPTGVVNGSITYIA